MPDLRSRLKLVRDELASARDEVVSAQTEVTDAKKAFEAADHDGKVTDWPEFKASQEAVKKLGQAKDKVADLEAADQGMVEMLAGSGSSMPVPRTPGGSEVSRPGDSMGLLRSSEGYMSAVERNVFTSRGQFGVIEMGELVPRESLAAFLQGARGDAIPGAPPGTFSTPDSLTIVPPDNRGLVPAILRQLTLLDLIGTSQTDSNVIEYSQQTGLPLGAAETAEGAVKPELGIEFTDASAPVRTIAGFQKVTRQAMSDVPYIAGLLNQQLPYAVRVRIENQIINGDGQGQNIKGILNTTGIVSETADAGDNTADSVLKLMTVLELGDALPNFIAVHPTVRQNLLLLRTESGGTANTGMYLYGGPGTQAAPTLWGMALIRSRILDPTKAFVGDSNGAELVIREGINVKTSDSDQDDFVRNRVTLLAECRLALPVYRPGHFGITTLN
jgi:HK97 family phage major capsid protein